MDNEEQQREEATTLCPFCAESIKAIAIKCKHCGSDLVENNIDDNAPTPEPRFITPPRKKVITKSYKGNIKTATLRFNRDAENML